MLRVFVHEHLIRAGERRVRLFDVDDERVAHDLARREADDLVLRAQDAAERSVFPIVLQKFAHAALLEDRGLRLLAVLLRVLLEIRLDLRQILRRDLLERPVGIEAAEAVDVVFLPVQLLAGKGDHGLRVIEIVAPVALQLGLQVREGSAQRLDLLRQDREEAKRLALLLREGLQLSDDGAAVAADGERIDRADAGEPLAQDERAVDLGRRVLKIALPEHRRAGAVVAQARGFLLKRGVQPRDVRRCDRGKKGVHRGGSISCRFSMFCVVIIRCG